MNKKILVLVTMCLAQYVHAGTPQMGGSGEAARWVTTFLGGLWEKDPFACKVLAVGATMVVGGLLMEKISSSQEGSVPALPAQGSSENFPPQQEESTSLIHAASKGCVIGVTAGTVISIIGVQHIQQRKKAQNPWEKWHQFVHDCLNDVLAKHIEKLLLRAYVVGYCDQEILQKDRGDTLTYDSFQKRVSIINGEDGSSTPFFTITRLSQEDAEKLCKDLQHLFLQKRQSNADDGGTINSLTVQDIFKEMEKLVCEASN